MPGQPGPGSNPVITIDCTSVQVADPMGSPSNLIIQSTDAFQVTANWHLAGWLANWLVGLGVQYSVRYNYESMGPGPEGTLGVVGPKPTIAAQLNYGAPDTTLTVPAGTLPAGVYRLTAVVSFGGSPPITAFNEGPMIEIF
jgi:hypothetical protein